MSPRRDAWRIRVATVPPAPLPNKTHQQHGWGARGSLGNPAGLEGQLTVSLVPLENASVSAGCF